MLRVKQGVCGLTRVKSDPCGGGRMQISIRRRLRTGKNCSGGSETELMERYPGAGGEVTGRFGNVFNPSETHDAHRKSAQVPPDFVILSFPILYGRSCTNG